MSFWRCYYHIVWTTKNREPLITAASEGILFDAVRRKCAELKCEIQALNAVSDHIHVAVCIPPAIAVADWVKHVKGTSSFAVNSMFPSAESHFRWQSGYGVLTFGTKNLPFVVRYIQNQKQHHADGTLQTYLERTED
jgi:putative transposase